MKRLEVWRRLCWKSELISFPHCIPMSINKKTHMTFWNIRELNHGNSVSYSKRDTSYSIPVISRDTIYITPISLRKNNICVCNYAQTRTDHHILGNTLFYTLYSSKKFKFDDLVYNSYKVNVIHISKHKDLVLWKYFYLWEINKIIKILAWMRGMAKILVFVWYSRWIC